MIYIFATLILWNIFWLLVPLTEWRKYYPSLIFAALLALISDLWGIVFEQWKYRGPTLGEISLWSVCGIAPAAGVLFIRMFPSRKNTMIKVLYLTLWGIGNTFFEWVFVRLGLITYIHWNILKAFLFYLCYFGLVWGQEYWYNGTGRLRIK